MKIIKYKKILTVIGILTIIVPISLSTIGCNEIKYSEDQQVVDAINKANYELEISVNSTVKSIEALIQPDFIKNQLNENIQSLFKIELFTNIKILNDKNKELQDKELEISGKIKTKIRYDYDNIKDQSTILEVSIKPE